MQLPFLNGFEFIKYFQEQEKKNIPVYALTSMAMAGDKEYILTRGFDGYISKPINTRHLSKFLLKFKEHNSEFN